MKAEALPFVIIIKNIALPTVRETVLPLLSADDHRAESMNMPMKIIIVRAFRETLKVADPTRSQRGRQR